LDVHGFPGMGAIDEHLYPHRKSRAPFSKSAMNEEPTQKQSTARLDTSTQLAYERTYLAHERTLMGCRP
jgi:hypothetical protein